MWCRFAIVGVAAGLIVGASAVAPPVVATPTWAHDFAAEDRAVSRTAILPFATIEDARARDRSRSPWVRSLSGAWRFQWTTEGAESDAFHQPDFNADAWSEIVVPSNWEAVGFGSSVPGEARGVGSYRRSFRIDPTWAAREVFLRFEGVGPAAMVWVNGVVVGRSQGSKRAAEFRLSDVVRDGENTLAVQVFGMGGGESGWLSGISRDVTLYATNPCRIDDVDARAFFDTGSGIGRVRVVVTLHNYGAETVADMLLEATLHRGDRVFTLMPARVTCEPNYPVLHVFELDVDDVEPWSANAPALYDIVLSHDGDAVSIPIGFRRLEVRDGVFHVNGQTERLRGVRLRDVHPDFGHAVPVDILRRDIALMKSAHINAVWSDGFPADPRWLELCDRAGLYVVDEVNARERMGAAANDSVGVQVIGERARAMVRRDRNHPSVIAWSLDTDATEEMVGWLREQADQRLILHRADLGLDLRSDLRVTTVWPSPDDMTREGTADRERGVLYGHLQHVSGNSLGGFSELWSTLVQYPNLAGGFVSQWNDANEGHARGLVTGRRFPRPALAEVRAVFEPLAFGVDDAEEGRYHLTNHYRVNSLDGYRVAWDVQADGGAVLTDTLAVDAVPPGERFPFVVITDGIEPEPGREYILTLTALEPRAAEVVAREQFLLPIFRSPAPVEVADGVLEVSTTSDSVTVRGGAFETTFLRARGEWVSYRHEGRELLVKGPVPNFWRAPTDIDVASGFAESGEVWKQMSESPEFTDFEILDEDEEKVRLRTRFGLSATGGASSFTYTVHANGDVDVVFATDLGDGESAPPRVGFRLWVPPTLEVVEWFGTGPHETYSDRRESGLLSRHTRSVTAPLPDYGRDQARGNREGVRWMVVSGTDGAGWLVVGEKMFATSVRASRARAEGEAPTSSAAVEWRIDVAHRGVGGSVPRATGPEPAHTIGTGSHELRVRFRPHDATLDPAARARATR